METVLGWVPALAGWFAALFTNVEWRVLILLVATTLGLTQTIKVAWRLLPIPGGGNRTWINLIAAVIGLTLSLLLWPGEFLVRMSVGFIIGPLAVLLFKIGFGLLKKYLPSVAARVNVDRRVCTKKVKTERRQS